MGYDNGFLGTGLSTGFLDTEKEERIHFFCPCCERERYGEDGEEFKGEIICISCLEGLIE